MEKGNNYNFENRTDLNACIIREQLNTAWRKPVRPIDISDESISCLYRFEGSVEPLGGLAQLEERVLCKHEVIGSSPIFSTKYGLIAQSVRAHA